MTDNTIDQQFVEFIIKSLVSRPDEVKIERRIDEKGVLLELTVDPEDLGRVIGKRGATAQSVRTLLRALGTKNDARYNLKIIDNGVGGHNSGDSTSGNSNWGADTGGSGAASTSTTTQADDHVATRTSQNARDDVGDDVSSVVSKTRKELEDLDDLEV